MANSGLQQSRWYFTKEQLENSPSRKCGIDADKELSNRQQAANLIQDMGQRLNVTQLCINTAIVYMHRFYVFHSFTKFHRNQIAPCALFLAAKVEEQPRKLEHVIKVAHRCLSREPGATLDPQSDLYKQQAARLVKNENIMLQTLGFEIGISHPHTFVVKCCTLVKASRDLAQTSYFMATNSLHLTTMCLMYRPTVVACACIHLACKWSSWEIPKSKEGKDWFLYVDEKVTLEELEQLTAEFIAILDKCPSRLKRRIMTGGIATGHSTADSPSSSNAVGASSTPNATFSSPMMTSPREEKPHSSTTSVPSMGYHQQQQQQQQHVPSATVTSNQMSSMVVREERREEVEVKHDPVSVPASVVPSMHSTNQESRPSQNISSQVKVEMKESVIPALSVSSSSFPSSHPSHHYQRDHSSSTTVGVASPTVINSHPQPIVLKIPLKGPSLHDSDVSSLGHRERSDSHGSSKSKNHHSSSQGHVGDIHTSNNWPSSAPKIDSVKIKIVGGQVFKKDDEEKRKDDERYREEDRRKRKRDEFERTGSRRDSRDDKRSKDRSSKHHNR